MFAGFTSTPMPGETLEGGENGEIQNPYYNPGFEDMAEDLAGEVADEGKPTIPETEPQLQQAQQEGAGDNGYDSTAPPTEDDEKPDNAITDTFGAEWDKGDSATSIADQQQHIQQNYTDGAIEQASQYLEATAEEAIQHANTDFEGDDERTAQQQEDQQIKNVSEAITAQAMVANIEAQKTAEAVALGDTDESEHAAKLAEAQSKIEQLASAGYISVQDAGTQEIADRAKQAIAEAQDISRTAAQQVEQTRANVAEAQAEAQEAADAQAAANGTDSPELNFNNLDDTLDDEQKKKITDAYVADNSNAPERE